MLFKIVLMTSCAITLLTGQIHKPGGYILERSDKNNQGLLGNVIVDILTRDSLVWVATGYGLNKTSDDGKTWQNFTSRDYVGKGGITAMTYMDENTLWIASSYDTLTGDAGELPAGGGLSYTSDQGETWFHIPQPVDSRDVTEYNPTTTNIQNLTFDIAVLDSTIWIASFGGGLRKSNDMGQSWQVVTTDGIPFSAIDYLNHRAFSVMTENGNIWIGTAAGISKSTDAGVNWQRFTHTNQEFPISGNFVVALAYQAYTNTIWAATIETDTSDFRAVSKSVNGGESWEIMLEGTFPHNFAFDGPVTYVAADEGMFVSNNGGETWYLLPPVRDSVTGEEILTNIFYSAGVSKITGTTTFWAGSADGLGATSDNGNSWTVHRSFKSTRQPGVAEAYAYPSPFSPSRQGYIRFQYDISRAGEVVVDIFDFAMAKVASIRDYKASPDNSDFDRSTKWNGVSENGEVVASGVYFFRLQFEDQVKWGKFVVIN